MINPYLSTLKLAQHGTVTISSDAPAETVVYPRSIGCVVTPMEIVRNSISLNCFWKFPNTGNLTDIEMYMHKLNENIASIGTADLTLHGVTFNDCCCKNVEAKEVKHFMLNYNMDFDIGAQNTYPTQNTVTYNQLTGMPTMRDFRMGKFILLGKVTPFYLGHYVNQLKSVTFDNTENKKQTWAYEYDYVLVGGIEKIILNGWIVNSNYQEILTFAYNVISGIVGKIGTLTVGADSTTLAFFQSFKLEEIKAGSAKWSATFISSLKC